MWISALQVVFFGHGIVYPLRFLPAEQLFTPASHHSSKIDATMWDTQKGPGLGATTLDV